MNKKSNVDRTGGKNSRRVKIKKGRKGFSPRFPSLGAGVEEGAVLILSPEEYDLAVSLGLAEPHHEEPVPNKGTVDDKPAESTESNSSSVKSAPAESGKKGGK